MFGRVDARERDDIPSLRGREIVGDHLATGILDVEAEEAGRRTDVEHPLAGEGRVAEVGLDVGRQVPLALDGPVPGDGGGMIKVAVLEPRRLVRRSSEGEGV